MANDRWKWAGAIAVAAIVVVTVVLLAGGGEDGDEQTGGRTEITDPGPIHVHGLGVNPKDGALFIATHTGLFRAPSGATKATRVAGRFQDTMGFTVVGADRFLGSGHPDARDGLPPFLGLIESLDAGESWKAVSLQGQSDFHVLEASGERVYGFGSDFNSRQPQFLVSGDGGSTWEERRVPEPLVSLALDARDSDRLVASGEQALYASTNGGRKWIKLAEGAGLVAWPARDRLYLVDGQGGVRMSRDSGRRWAEAGQTGGQPAAFEAEAAEDLYVALHDGTVKRSTDGGESWTVRSTP